MGWAYDKRGGNSHMKEGVMYVVVRSYSGQGASGLFDLMGQREQDVTSPISGVPGCVSYDKLICTGRLFGHRR
jgi:hypothetical protein